MSPSCGTGVVSVYVAVDVCGNRDDCVGYCDRSCCRHAILSSPSPSLLCCYFSCRHLSSFVCCMSSYGVKYRSGPLAGCVQGSFSEENHLKTQRGTGDSS